MNEEVTPAAALTPWVRSKDGTTWRAFLPDGRMTVIERLEDGDEDGNGASFLPRISAFGKTDEEATGPVCDGLMSASQWVTEYAGFPNGKPAESDELPPLEERVEFLADRVAELVVSTVRADSIRQIADIFWNEGFKAAQAKMLARLDALDVRVEELEARAR